MRIIYFCLFVLIAGTVVNAVESKSLCGFIAPNTIPLPNGCDTNGLTGNFTYTITWNDGSYSLLSVFVTTQLVVGSCCSAIRISHYATGVVTSGRFSGENVIEIFTYRDSRQTFNGCQQSDGLASTSIQVMLSIGKKGVGDWIECTGSATILFSPPLSNANQTIYATLSAALNTCSNFVQSC